MAKSRVSHQSLKSAKRRVPLVVQGIEGKEVAVTGDFTGWSEDGIRLTRDPNGEWRTTLELESGEYQYRLRVDGEWRGVPQAERCVPNPYGSDNALLTVS